MTLSRRELLRAIAYSGGGLAAAGLLQACGDGTNGDGVGSSPTGPGGGQGAGEAGTVDVWSPDTRDAAIESEQWWHSEFASQSQFNVEQLTVPYGDDVTRLQSGHATGDVPDIIWSYGDQLYTYGVDGMAQSVSGSIDEIGRERFIPATLEGIEIGGEIYAVPFVGFPFFVYYRRDLYEEAGLEPPETHEDLLANIEALHDPPDRYGYLLTNKDISDVWNLRTAMWTHGAYYFDEAGELALDRQETVDAWEYYKSLGTFSSPGSMGQSDVEVRELMVDGLSAHMFTTTSFAANFTEENVEQFGGFVYPRRDGARGASLDFYGLTVPAKAEDPEGAKELIQFIFDPERYQEFLARTVVGWVPMLQDAYTDEYLSNERIELVSRFIELGDAAAEGAVVGTGYFGPTESASALVASDVEKQIGDRLVIEDQSPEEVIDWATQTIEQEL